MRRRWLVALALVVVAAVLAAAGLAFYVATSTAGSSGRARAAFLPTGSQPTASVSGRDVVVGWSQSSVPALGGLLGAQAHGGYTITRYAESAPSTAITPGANCSGTQTGNSDPLSCTESSLPTGRWKYTVTPSYYNWIGGESTQSLHAIIAPAAPSTVTLANGGGVGSAYVNAADKSSLTINVALVATSLASDTVALSLSDGVHSPVTASKPATAGAGTVSFTGVDASSLSDGSITISATSSSSYGDASSATQITRTKDTVAPVVHATASRVPDSNGWYNHAVTFSASTSTDTGGSGIQSCDADVVYSTPDTASGSKSFTCTDLAGNSASNSISFKYDATLPAAVNTFPANSASYNNSAWTAGCNTSPFNVTNSICGTATDATSGVALVKVSIQGPNGKYWNGTDFNTAASEQLFTASGTSNWTLAFPASNFATAGGGAGSYTVRSYATDAASNTQTAASASTFTLDNTAPSLTSLQMFDTDQNGKVDRVVATFSESLNTSYSAPNTVWTLTNAPGGAANVISGTPTVSGSSVTLTLAEGTVNTAPGVYSGSTLAQFGIALAANANGVRDLAGNQASFANTSVVDKAAPVATSLAVSHSDNKPSEDDTIDVVFSEPLAVTSMCSTFSGNTADQTTLNGNGSPVTFAVNNNAAPTSGNDLFVVSTVSSGNCTSGFSFGTVDMGSQSYVSSNQTIAGPGSNGSMLKWTFSTRTLHFNLGNTGTFAAVTAATTAKYTVGGSMTDIAGNVAVGAPTETANHW